MMLFTGQVKATDPVTQAWLEGFRSKVWPPEISFPTSPVKFGLIKLVLPAQFFDIHGTAQE